MESPKQPVEPVKPIDYSKADLYERTHNRAIFAACWRDGLRDAMLAHLKINNPVAIWRDGKVVMVSPAEILKGLDGA
jgi:hypothetical protein